MTESLADDEAAYAYVRMKLGNDEYSERVKFAFVVWQGTYWLSPCDAVISVCCVLLHHVWLLILILSALFLRFLGMWTSVLVYNIRFFVFRVFPYRASFVAILTIIRHKHQSNAESKDVVSKRAG